MLSDANAGGMAAEVEPSQPYSIMCCPVTDGSRGALWQSGIWHGSTYEAKRCHWIPPCGKNRTTDIHQHLVNVSGDQTVDVSTVRLWVVHFSSGNTDSGLPLLVQIFMNAALYLWQKSIANSGGHVKKRCFVAENLLYQTVLFCSLYLL